MAMEEPGSVVGIETGIRPGRSGVRFQVGTRDLRDVSVFPNVPTGSGAYPAFRSMGYCCFFLGLKRSGREIDHSAHLLSRLKEDTL
jgi:hypothetical protein